MYLRRVRIYGFKSFAQDVALELRPGITALVGPNGGGKSNVVDAIRWALGEQRLKDLRAERWEDLLHQGGPGRAAARLAEVSLEFDNQDGDMPHWAESMTVARRYYRSGDSEYLINGQSARLKDVTDLFLDSGLGRFSYAIISQGRVEGALLQKPLERLEQLEEAAGVSRYKVRKKETVTHLQETELKLVRLADLQDEVRRQMDEVRERAEVESRYRTWEILRQDWQRRLDYTEYRRAMDKRDKLEAQLARLGEERRALTFELNRVLEETSACRQEVTQASEASDVEAEELKALRLRETALRVEKTEAEGRVAQIQRERGLIKEAMNLLQVQQSQLSGEREQAFRDLGEVTPLRDQEAELVRTLARAQQDRDEASRALDGIRQDLASLHLQRGHLEQRLARLKGLLRMGEDEETIMEAIHIRQGQAEALGREVRQLTEEVVHLTEERTRLKQFAVKAEQELDNLRHQLAGRQARLRALRQLEAEGEGLNAGVRAVLKGQQQGKLSGVIGTLGSLVESPGDLLLAVQTALGGAHQDLVMESEERARQAVRYLKTGSLGRATFLPLDTVRAARVSADDYRRLAREAGVIGWAADLVKSEPMIHPAVQHVLGRVVIVQSLDDAARLGPIHHFRYKMVTLDGQVVHAGGAITGGSRVADKNSLQTRKVEVDELSRRIREDGEVAAGREELLQSAKRDLDEVEHRLDAAREILAERRNQWQQVRAALNADGIGDPAELVGALEDLDRQATAKEEEQQRRQEDWETRQADWQRLSHEVEAARSIIREREQGLREQQIIGERIEREMSRLSEQTAAQRARSQALDLEESARMSDLEQAQEALALVEQEGLRREKERALRVKEMTRIRERLLSLENRQRVLELEDRKMEQKSHAWNQEILEITVRFEQFEPADNLEPLSRSEEETARREVQRIAHSLSELGPVVPGSLALFEQLEERQGFLMRESQDVEEARRELEATLKEIDQEMERRVKETASRVEHAFAEACRQLYGGGDGGFNWVGGDNAGVELWVRPPGKRPSHLALLSGGEKALGGIAWLFSLLSVRPSPFVVLDEVEASLDEANAVRFAQYMRVARGTAQYVIVTHQRQTMEAADALWGVAGNGHGQSRLISVLLSDAEQLTS